MIYKSTLTVFLLAGLAYGCMASGPDDPAPPATLDEPIAAVSAGRSLRLQAGTKLVTYGVTEDGFAIYQDGPTLYATALYPGAARRLVAQVGATQPTVLISGRVALIWTSQFYFGAGGVSPLVVWTAEAGPKLASTSSVVSFVGTGFAAVRPDSEQILFVTNASADGTVGDIVSATPDLRVVRTLITGANVNVIGACPPLVGFDGKPRPNGDARGPAPHPVIAQCPAGVTTATLSRWVDGRRRDLAQNLAPAPTWSSDTRGERFFTIVDAVARTPVVVSAEGAITVLENVPTARGFINFDGAILTRATLPAGRELHRITGASPRTEVVANLGNSTFFVGHHAEGFRQYTDMPTSRDGRLMLYGDVSDPQNGTTNLFLVDVSQVPPMPLPLQSDPVVLQSFELFTSDSTHGLYYKFDPTTGGLTLFAASLAGDNRAVSSGAPTEVEHFALTGSLVAYSDNLVGTGIDLLDKTDIVLADVGAAQIAPVTLAPEAYNLFFPTADRRAIVYTSDHDPNDSGLFIVRTR